METTTDMKTTFTQEEKNLIGFALYYLKVNATTLSEDFSQYHDSIVAKLTKLTQD
jgi:hypothetical protein